MKHADSQSRLARPGAANGARRPPETTPAAGIGDGSQRVEALCERVRQMARAAGEETLGAKGQQGKKLVEESRQRAESESRARIARVRHQAEMRANQRVQAARLTARADIAGVRWSELTRVLDEAESEVTELRHQDPERYAASIVRLFQLAADQLGSTQLVVRAHSEDLPVLRDRLQQAVGEIEFCPDEDIAAGVVVTTADGTRACDQSVPRRRQRYEDELRLAAAELLFPSTGSPRQTTTAQDSGGKHE